MDTDEKLREQVLDELKWDLALKAEQILVQVSDGIVTISGHVASHAERWHAEQAVTHVSGVVDLINNIEVVLPSQHVRTDSDLVAAAVSALQWNTSLADQQVKVSVADGWLVLGGEVDSEHQRQTAGYAVRYLQGIKGISNDIVVKPHASSDTIKTDIEAAFRRKAIIDAHGIEVRVQDGAVTLSGAVGSLLERDMARSTAAGTAGVLKVVDNLVVSAASESPDI
ncbi:BON domain-containing protein [Pseudomonas gingeri]|uniref:BON domain-containing protein n=1 Tax=Pseudomonas gingeri TaxID=117681 RepID=A0A7Y7WLP3_9PSED|nr:BON domain-containing protein [Pseudomonas gingeri]NWB83814.1 BON domain-containing protein [Pseudomonas gingeri]